MTRARLPLVLGLLVAPIAVAAQFGNRPPDPDFEEYNVPYDGRVTFVRLRYTPYRARWTRGPNGYFGGVDYFWNHDYPRADTHFSTMMHELTAVPMNTDGSEIFSLDDPALFKFPIAYLVEPGSWTITESEVRNLRNYLLKGGFLIVDDFVDRQWSNFQRVMAQVLPDARYVKLDVAHPIFHSFFTIDDIEHDMHPYDRGLRASYLGVFENNDPSKRLMVIINFNNDIGESWEWSDTGYISISLTNEAYKLGINYLVYALTH